LLIGSGKEALNIYNELENQPKSLGNKFIGYVTVNDKNNQALHSILPNLGKLNSLPQIVDDNHIEEVIIAIEPGEHNDIFEIIDILGMTEVTVKALPDLHTVLKGSVGISNIFGTPLIEIKHEPMSVWHRQTKLFIDIMGSLIAMIVLLPLYLFCALGIKLSSKGPIFLRQERIGRYGKPFIFYKFRSMYINAEKDGPNLASRGDCRVTPFGKFLRRTKFDEIPNFWNVLKGDMSLVGPRPERRYYIDQIVKIAPHYLQLQKIKPGITSLGQVKFGYAENVEQMTQRLRYDILYLENMSLYVDFKIFIYTVRLLLKGRHI
jgi:exopolysaccharide biosynthesis polyprenyl glycosylphosphotransferase